jgi:hypothetical protein
MPLFFWSNAKTLYPLSNLAHAPTTVVFPREGVPAHLAGMQRTAPSAEHLWVMCHTADAESASKVAELGMEAFRAWPKFIGRAKDVQVSNAFLLRRLG